MISVGACFVFCFFLLIWSSTLEKRVKLLEDYGCRHISTVIKVAFIDLFLLIVSPRAHEN